VFFVRLLIRPGSVVPLGKIWSIKLRSTSAKRLLPCAESSNCMSRPQLGNSRPWLSWSKDRMIRDLLSLSLTIPTFHGEVTPQQTQGQGCFLQASLASSHRRHFRCIKIFHLRLLDLYSRLRSLRCRLSARSHLLLSQSPLDHQHRVPPPRRL